jgi:hypothetical protein
MTKVGSHVSAATPADASFEYQLLSGIAAYQKALNVPDRVQLKTCKKRIQELLKGIQGPEQAELLPTLMAMPQLGNSTLTISALTAIGNLEGEGARAVPMILAEGLKGSDDLFRTASYALGSIPGRASVLALVELFEGRRKYALLTDATLPSFILHGQECAPFISQVEDTLSRIAPQGAFEHLELLNTLRWRLRELRALDYLGIDFPDQILLDPLIQSPDKAIGDLIEFERKELPDREGLAVQERFRFCIQDSKSEIGLEIHRLPGEHPNYLVTFVEDELGYGVQIPEIVDCLAAVITAQYGLNPRTTNWTTLTKRESGYASGSRDEYRLYSLKHEPASGRYSLSGEIEFKSLRRPLAFVCGNHI